MKRYVYAMAFPKAEALRRASYYSQDILEHLIKIVVYGRQRRDDISHWVGEIASWLKSADSLAVKPTSRPLKQSEVQNTVFCCMGDSLNDYLESLMMFQHDNKKGKFNHDNKPSYPEVNPDAQTASDLMDVCFELMNKTTPLICSKESHTRQEFEDVLRSILNLHHF